MLSREFNSDSYWENRYQKGGNSGAGSYNHLARFKADIINNFIKNNDIKTLIDYGVGDGNQLKLIDCKNITGLDVSKTIINKLKNEYNLDKNKQFYLCENFVLNDSYDLAISCDVLYHLIDLKIWKNYLSNLFSYSNKYIIIYASNENKDYGSHCLARNFTEYINKEFPTWKLIKKIENKYKYSPGSNNKNTSISDFFIYQKTN